MLRLQTTIITAVLLCLPIPSMADFPTRAAAGAFFIFHGVSISSKLYPLSLSYLEQLATSASAKSYEENSEMPHQAKITDLDEMPAHLFETPSGVACASEMLEKEDDYRSFFLRCKNGRSIRIYQSLDHLDYQAFISGRPAGNTILSLNDEQLHNGNYYGDNRTYSVFYGLEHGYPRAKTMFEAFDGRNASPDEYFHYLDIFSTAIRFLEGEAFSDNIPIFHGVIQQHLQQGQKAITLNIRESQGTYLFKSQLNPEKNLYITFISEKEVRKEDKLHHVSVHSYELSCREKFELHHYRKFQQLFDACREKLFQLHPDKNASADIALFSELHDCCADAEELAKLKVNSRFQDHVEMKSILLKRASASELTTLGW